MESTTANTPLLDPTKGQRTTRIGIAISVVLAIVKAVGGILGNSYALIADAIESTVDIITSGLLLVGLRWSAKPADDNHPYGHGKAEALVAIGISLALCGAAVVIAIESIHNISVPHESPKAFTLIILVLVILTKEILARYVNKTGEELGSGAVKADAFHHRSDAITSAAAFIGIGIGLIGGPGYEMADDWAALFAALIIVINAYKIARPAVGELLDEELDTELNQAIRKTAATVPGVIHVEKCHTRKMGIMAHADMHIWVNENLSVAQGHRIAHTVKDTVREKHPRLADVHIHIEPASEQNS